jgi:predicted alpha/beta-fold hydrolase
MQRPVMDVQYMREVEEASKPKPPRDWFKYIRPIGWGMLWLGEAMVRMVATPLIRRAKAAPPVPILVRGLLYRLMFLPILITLIASLLVYLATHPRTYVAQLDPITIGVYYDPVTLVAADGVRSDGWLAPAVDAKKILSEKEKALRLRSPGVVLVHDMGETGRQMLPLVRPLHEAGYVVLVVGVRGSGSAQPVGQTFGLLESLDVRAAVDMLRRRSYVDPQRVAVVGVGAGATAAVLAREQDPTITGLVLIDLPTDVTTPVKSAMTYNSPMLKWMTPICRWTFEVAYQVNLSDLDTSRTVEKLDRAQTVQLSGIMSDGLSMKRDRSKPVTEFLKGLFATKQAVAKTE